MRLLVNENSATDELSLEFSTYGGAEMVYK